VGGEADARGLFVSLLLLPLLLLLLSVLLLMLLLLLLSVDFAAAVVVAGGAANEEELKKPMKSRKSVLLLMFFLFLLFCCNCRAGRTEDVFIAIAAQANGWRSASVCQLNPGILVAVASPRWRNVEILGCG
jgi:hypothetical protein